MLKLSLNKLKLSFMLKLSANVGTDRTVHAEHDEHEEEEYRPELAAGQRSHGLRVHLEHKARTCTTHKP